MKLRNIILTLIVIALVAGGLYWAFRPQPIGVDAASIATGTLVVTVDDEGVAKIRDTYKVSTPIGGDVQRIPFTVGDLISEGDVVATILPQLSGFLDERARAEAEAAVRAAEAAVASARAEVAGATTALEYQQNEVERTSTLRERGIVTDQAAERVKFELENRQTLLDNAEATLELRLRQLEQAEVRLLEPDNLDRRTIRYDIRAPATGQVLEIDNESARSLPIGAHLLTIGDPGNLYIEVDLVSTDAVKVVTGAPATITGWGQETPLEAVVRRIEPIGFTKVSALGIEEQRVRVHLDITSDPELWQTLGHLYRVFVQIETGRYEDSLLVPTSALFRQDDDWAAYTIDGEVAKLNILQLGARDAGFAVVEEGLAAGDQVIVHPSDTITDGGLVIDRALLE